MRQNALFGACSEWCLCVCGTAIAVPDWPRFVEETWFNWLPKAVAKPFYRDQLTAHVAELEHPITNLGREIERQFGGLPWSRDFDGAPAYWQEPLNPQRLRLFVRMLIELSSQVQLEGLKP